MKTQLRLCAFALVTKLGATTLAQSDEQSPPIHNREWYERHILAIDEDENALRPCVLTSNPSDPRYKGRFKTMEGEDTRNAVVNRAALKQAVDGHTSTNPPPFSGGMTTALKGRKPLTDYLDGMFHEVSRRQPKEVVIYIHGGLNDINGAIAKAALLADVLDGQGKYFIGICWNSNLMPTYDQHLLAVREGLHQNEEALVTVPAMLLADIGGAAVRFPLNLINFLYQDAYTVNPNGFIRTKLANARFTQILNASQSNRWNAVNAIQVSRAGDERSEFDRWVVDFGRWMVTYPVKAGSTLVLDSLGIQPWKNMLRRTRTMFERESEFIPDLSYYDAVRLAKYLGTTTLVPHFVDELNYTGRKGAMWHFCNKAEQNLTVRNKAGDPKVTIIGHSMGAIVTAEMLQRFHRLPVDNIVLMAAACSINDFKNKIVPYLQEQNLRAEIARAAPGAARFCAPLMTTHLFNLCLNDEAEHIEPNPGQFDLSQRGSLLTWIDTLYQTPESENDRTFGRWVNAVLATDDIPKDVIPRITIKGFGLDRRRQPDSPTYTVCPGSAKVIDEPTKHGEFSRYDHGRAKRKSNFKFWDETYREPEASNNGRQRRNTD